MLEVDLSSGSYSISSGWLLAVARVVVHQQHRQHGFRTGIKFGSFVTNDSQYFRVVNRIEEGWSYQRGRDIKKSLGKKLTSH